MTQMTDEQLRGETWSRALTPDVVVYDYGKLAHLCPECGEMLTTVRCSESCPHYRTCEDAGIHVSVGEAWCPVAREEDANSFKTNRKD